MSFLYLTAPNITYIKLLLTSFVCARGTMTSSLFVVFIYFVTGLCMLF